MRISALNPKKSVFSKVWFESCNFTKKRLEAGKYFGVPIYKLQSELSQLQECWAVRHHF
jgi:hypothetical protein